MINNDNDDSVGKKAEETTEKQPDEKSGTVVQAFFKIFDPESGEVLVQGRD